MSWSETNVVQATARRRDAKAFYLLDEEALGSACATARSRELVETAPPEARVALADLPFDPPAGHVAAVRVVASITHTIGGLRVDERARVLRDDGSALDGLWAAGVDAGGVATGGYASGLAQALVLGPRAAEDVAGAGAEPFGRCRRRWFGATRLADGEGAGAVSPGSGEAPIL